MHINLLSYIQTCSIHGALEDTYKLVLMHMWVQQHADKHCVKIMSDFGFLCYNWMKKSLCTKRKSIYLVDSGCFSSCLSFHTGKFESNLSFSSAKHHETLLQSCANLYDKSSSTQFQNILGFV